MGMSEVADIYFEKLTPEVVLNSLIWLDSNVSILGEYYQSPLKLKKKHKFKVTVGNKTIEGGNPKGKLITIKISSKAIKLAKEYEKGNWLKLREIPKRPKGKDKIREEYLKEYKKNFGSDLYHYSLSSLPLFSESFEWHFTKEKIDKERKSNSIGVDKAFPEYYALPREKKRKQVYVSDSQYELEIYLDHICIDPDLNRMSLPHISMMKKKLVKLCKLINATKGEFPVECNHEFYPKDKSYSFAVTKTKCRKCYDAEWRDKNREMN